MASAYSMHPNEKGIEVYAKAVNDKITELEGVKAEARQAEEAANNAPTEGPAAGTEGQQGTDDVELPATDEQINEEALHQKLIGLMPEDVVLKFFDSVQGGDYERAVTCLDPDVEEQINFWGGLVAGLSNLVNNENKSWGQLFFEKEGATDVAVIECYSDNLEYNSSFAFIADLLPFIPGIRYAFASSADVHVTYRYHSANGVYVTTETYRVENYGWKGWRIEL